MNTYNTYNTYNTNNTNNTIQIKDATIIDMTNMMIITNVITIQSNKENLPQYIEQTLYIEDKPQYKLLSNINKFYNTYFKTKTSYTNECLNV